jgi:hypothetical protein
MVRHFVVYGHLLAKEFATLPLEQKVTFLIEKDWPFFIGLPPLFSPKG